MLTVTNVQLKHLNHTIPAVAAMMDVNSRRAAVATQKRMQAAISLTAEERYDELSRTYPEFLRRFPPGNDSFLSWDFR
jgi:hypothetical protein